MDSHSEKLVGLLLSREGVHQRRHVRPAVPQLRPRQSRRKGRRHLYLDGAAVCSKREYRRARGGHLLRRSVGHRRPVYCMLQGRGGIKPDAQDPQRPSRIVVLQVRERVRNYLLQLALFVFQGRITALCFDVPVAKIIAVVLVDREVVRVVVIASRLPLLSVPVVVPA